MDNAQSEDEPVRPPEAEGGQPSSTSATESWWSRSSKGAHSGRIGDSATSLASGRLKRSDSSISERIAGLFRFHRPSNSHPVEQGQSAAFCTYDDTSQHGGARAPTRSRHLPFSAFHQKDEPSGEGGGQGLQQPACSESRELTDRCSSQDDFQRRSHNDVQRNASLHGGSLSRFFRHALNASRPSDAATAPSSPASPSCSAMQAAPRLPQEEAAQAGEPHRDGSHPFRRQLSRSLDSSVDLRENAQREGAAADSAEQSRCFRDRLRRSLTDHDTASTNPVSAMGMGSGVGESQGQPLSIAIPRGGHSTGSMGSVDILLTSVNNRITARGDAGPQGRGLASSAIGYACICAIPH